MLAPTEDAPDPLLERLTERSILEQIVTLKLATAHAKRDDTYYNNRRRLLTLEGELIRRGWRLTK